MKLTGTNYKDRMMTTWDYIEAIAGQFAAAELCYGHGTDNPLDEAVYLVCASLGLDFADGDALARRQCTEQDIELLAPLVRRRIEEREPVAYLTGQAWFGGRRFHSDQRALIPRSPLAELILNHCEPLLSKPPQRILDLCTGGGCIGITAALTFESATVVLADISAASLQLARDNIELHGVGDRVEAVCSDLFAELAPGFDLILCNPPYVGAAEIAALPAEYRHEPELGLLSAELGLQLPLQILRTAADYLTADGLLVMEVGYSHELLAERLAEVPLLWLEFEHGGEGVFALTTSQLQRYKACFN